MDAYQEEIKALIDFTNAEFAKMLPRTATWCKTPKVKPNPRASTNPAPGCLSFQNNILYFNGQPVGKGVFYDVLPSEGNEVTISGSDERILKSHFLVGCESSPQPTKKETWVTPSSKKLKRTLSFLFFL